MFQHALDDVVGALAVLDDLLQVPGQHRDHLLSLGTPVTVERHERGSGGLFKLIEQLGRKRREIIDEIERVLDLVRNPGGQLPQ